MKIAVALSGGGARCIAQLGYLQEIRNLGIECIAYSGSSGGAIVAAFLAHGLSPLETLKLINTFDFSKIGFNLFKGSIYTLEPLQKELETLGLRDFDDLATPLFVTLTRYSDAETIYMHKGSVAKAVLASSALIPIFSPITIEKESYIDGGFTDNLPVTPLMEYSFRLAINVNPPTIRTSPSLLGYLKKGCYTMFNANMKPSIPKASKYVQIAECGRFGILQRRNFDTIYNVGKEYGKKDRKEWEKLCNS